MVVNWDSCKKKLSTQNIITGIKIKPLQYLSLQ